MGDIADEILEMLKTGKILKIPMLDPDDVKRERNEPNIFAPYKSKIISETDYADKYKQKDDEEYLKVIHLVLYTYVQ